MLRPIGPKSAAVYWRRRLALGGTAVVLLVLIVLTFQALTSGGKGNSQAAAQNSSPTAQQPPPAAGSTTSSSSSSSGSSSPTSAGSSSSTGTGRGAAGSASNSPPPPGPCAASQLAVVAQAGGTSYQVGQHPKLGLQVTNTGTASCVQDLADSQVLLRVYNGESRVWGSHDCQTLPGSDDRTLASNQTVELSLSWAGLSSQPSCAGVRQRVGAGTYTLYAALSGHTGKAAQFTIR